MNATRTAEKNTASQGFYLEDPIGCLASLIYSARELAEQVRKAEAKAAGYTADRKKLAMQVAELQQRNDSQARTIEELLNRDREQAAELLRLQVQLNSRALVAPAVLANEAEKQRLRLHRQKTLADVGATLPDNAEVLIILPAVPA